MTSTMTWRDYSHGARDNSASMWIRTSDFLDQKWSSGTDYELLVLSFNT